ncbi:DUF3349 domain-containing protein [Gordonia soli]|uniref:DUF3349 domain-containing protein n=1 Tax=Gordonia soli NBRC 108243 TaxID=1223545 RepID=M0QI46_9ACTN|nr:DUF3349 domain-containing protein [Gordonia soli]GAC67961.1 hypothetical protein GS4_11_02300 [Gordonia soli NBRC 108243]
MTDNANANANATAPDRSKFESILDWLRAGYPEGVPPTDYFPLLALLARTLDERQITDAILTMFREHGTEEPITEEKIQQAIAAVINDQPNPEEVNQVASRLAAVGWPLASTEPVSS